MHISEFYKRVIKYQGADYLNQISISELAREFQSNRMEWQDLMIRGSDFQRVLSSLPDTEDGNLNVTTLVCLAILLCRGSLNEKVNTFVNLVQSDSNDKH